MNNRVTASFSIWSKKLRPDKISEIVQSVPDDFGIKGIERSPPRPRPTHYGWHISNREFNQALAGGVLDRLVIKLEPVHQKIPQLLEQDHDIEINFYLHVAPKSTDISLYIERKTIKFISSLNGSLDIEFFDL
jgi:Domain of unknown function (DUF4279)